jgi:type II secretory pathway pseudopilin PulG
MNRRQRMDRGGYTIVELLVVTSVFASLFGLVSVANTPGRHTQIRRTAQSLASILTATQGRALGRENGAAVILDADADTGDFATNVFHADSFPHIAGTATGIPPAAVGSLTASGTISPANADVADLQHGYKICFYEKTAVIQPPSGWMQFTPPAAATSNVATVSLRGTSGQTSANTIWPKPASPPFDVLIARYPVKSQTAMQCAKGAAVDLRYSGFGDDPATAYGSLNDKGAIAIAYDGVGGIEAVMQQVLSAATARTSPPIDPLTPVYLFVAAREDILDPTVNTLSSEEAVWVVLQPQTGRVHISANVPQTATSATAIRNARANARAGIPLGK